MEVNQVPELEGSKQAATHMSSAAAFVEGGVQDSCDEACSICLEEFSDGEPPTVTSCRHEFHLHCILEWCQRSSQCPMCWQAIGLKDESSQELLEAVERERKLRAAPTRNTAAIFHHPTLGDFELRHLPVGTSDAELEERIIRHLAAAAAMGRTHHVGRREGQRHRSSAHGRPHLMVFSTHRSPPSSGHLSFSLGLGEGENETAASPATNSPSRASVGHALLQQSAHVPSVITDQRSPPHVSPIPPSGRQGSSLNLRSTPDDSAVSHQSRAGPSDFQALSESIKARFNAVSMRYKESITKSTRGWKERFFSRNNSTSDMGSEGHRGMNAGIAGVSRMMDHLGTSSSRSNQDSVSIFSAGYPVAERSSHGDAETRRESNLNGSSPAHHSTGSSSS